MSLSIVIQTREKCYGVTFIDGKFMVSTSKDIYRVGMEGKFKKVHQLSKCCNHLASYPKGKRTFASIYSSTESDTVITELCSGNKMCVIPAGIVKGGRGIDVDYHGNLYICGQTSNNVVQVSMCGTQIRELLTSNDGIDSPGAISVRGDKIVVSNKNQDEIHVFQLY